MKRLFLTTSLALVALTACTSTPVTQQGTLAELDAVEADLDEVHLEDSLERAAQSYRRYLNETSVNKRTPEAMRRLADLQIEQAYGVMGTGDTGSLVEMAAPEQAEATGAIVAQGSRQPQEQGETDAEFEKRALGREDFLVRATDYEDELLGADGQPIPAGPREAIKTYQEILDTYPDYERNDRVLYQM